MGTSYRNDVAHRLEAVTIRLDAIAIRLEAIASRLEAIALRRTCILTRPPQLTIQKGISPLRSQKFRSEIWGFLRRVLSADATGMDARPDGVDMCGSTGGIVLFI